MNTPRNEYPRPQFVRKEWQCLNGEWEFEIDYNDNFRESGWPEKAKFTKKIIVPFCPESELSGIEHTDFMNAVWYRKEVEIPEEWRGKNIILHFQAVDYDAVVWVNGVVAGRHRGGFSPFNCELKGIAAAGEKMKIVVRAQDHKEEQKACGKQAPTRYSRGTFFRRTTGIWQTVWMEPVAETWLDRAKITPDIEERSFYIEQPIRGPRRKGMKVVTTLCETGDKLTAEALMANDFTTDDPARRTLSTAEKTVNTSFIPLLTLTIPGDRLKLWSPDSPFLYDIKIELYDADGNLLDSLWSYAGMRGISFDDMKVNLNGKPIFQRQVLDQGYNPKGIMTAPSDEDLKRDIELSMAMGFNSARLHQKVFEERFLYWADKLGYMVWGEFADWGVTKASKPVSDPGKHQPMVAMINSWIEIIHRDYSHPCIVGWCPLNEHYGLYVDDEITSQDDLMQALFHTTKSADSTRPVIDSSGYLHRMKETDIYDIHLYEQDPVKFKKLTDGIKDGKPPGTLLWTNPPQKNGVGYHGQPFYCSEFGGTKWEVELIKEDANPNISYGHGNVVSEEEFLDRFKQLCDVQLDNPLIFGYCFTQLTDIYLEVNGLYTFTRKPKFDPAVISKIQKRRAAIERE
jgi:beta-galactosidase/beta-glucuronidase